jgi:hypothetical protein
VSASVGLASGFAGLFEGPLGAVLGIVSAAFALGNAARTLDAPVDDPLEVQRLVSSQLGATFSQTADEIAGFNDNLFGGSADFDFTGLVSTLQSQGILPTDGLNPITEVFASGAFLADPSDNPMTEALKAGMDRIKLSLVAGLMRAQNWYVFINTQLAEDECTVTGSRFINGQCMIISKRNDESGSHTEPVDSSILLKLDDQNAGYNVDVTELYQNAVDCGGNQMDTSIDLNESGFPTCFWSLPILIVNGPDVCDLVPSDWAAAPGYPSGLKLTDKSCCDALICL